MVHSLVHKGQLTIKDTAIHKPSLNSQLRGGFYFTRKGVLSINRIKELRKANGVTAEKLAGCVGISQSMLTNYENGSTVPRDCAVWKKLSEYFGISISYLLGLTDILSASSLDATQIQERYIKGKQPLEYIVSSEAEYRLLACMQMLEPDEMIALLRMSQHFLMERKEKSP